MTTPPSQSLTMTQDTLWDWWTGTSQGLKHNFGNAYPASYFTPENCLDGTRNELSDVSLLSQHDSQLALPAPPQAQLPDFVVNMPDMQDTDLQPSDKDVAAARHGLD
ncbi:hypothetical protein DSO57_1007474 [Entomophthora muscae]|uniref:Uncharacterized protein n=1 Tax=Entomophthora muscae TaxID=34485 RepID=A0ACC2SWA0_9FUNG|nr:hypothetical protein DSO57_1007474 [Entomophthora muscae]